MEFYEVSNLVVSLCLTFDKGTKFTLQTSNDTCEDCWALKLDLTEDNPVHMAETITQIQSLKPLAELDCCGLIDVCWVPAIREGKVFGYYKIKTGSAYQEKELDFVAVNGKTLENIDFYFWLLARDFWKMNKEVADSLRKAWFNSFHRKNKPNQYESTWKYGLDKVRFFNLVYDSLVALDKAKDNLNLELVEEFKHFVFDAIEEEQLFIEGTYYDGAELEVTTTFCDLKIRELIEPLQQLVEQGFQTFDSSDLVRIFRDNNIEGCIGGWTDLLKKRLELYERSKQSNCPIIERMTPFVLVNRAKQCVVFALDGVSLVDGGVDKIYFTHDKASCTLGSGVQWEVVTLEVILEQNLDLKLETAQGLIVAHYRFVPKYCDVGLVVSANPSAEQVAQYALLGIDQRWLDYTVVGDTKLVGDRELVTAEIFDALLGTETKAQYQIRKIIKANHKKTKQELETF